MTKFMVTVSQPLGYNYPMVEVVDDGDYDSFSCDLLADWRIRVIIASTAIVAAMRYIRLHRVPQPVGISSNTNDEQDDGMLVFDNILWREVLDV